MSAFEAKTVIGQPFMELTVTDSTNIYAMGQLQAGTASHGASFFAHHQTAGKGQHGKQWTDEAGQNIALSVVVDCSFLSVSNQFPLSVMAAVACHDFFSSYAGDETFVKWPNDIYWRDRKAGGILIENQVKGLQWPASVIGIGININQSVFPDHLKNPVSLKQISGKTHDPVGLARALCSCIDNRYTQLKNGLTEELLVYYNEILFKRGEQVKLKYGSIVFNCMIDKVTGDGRLHVLDGLRDSFAFGEVEWVI